MNTTNLLPPGTDEQTDPTTLASAERQLKVSAILTVGFGLMFSLGSHDSTDVLVRWFSDFMFLRVGDGPAQLTDVNHLSDAILGGLMVGWAVMVWLMADRLLVRAPKEIKSIITIAMLVWFPIDSIGSIASGAWLNAIANVGFLAMFLVPLRRV